MSIYLTELADVLRRAGLPVVEYDGWQTRARSSGGYASGRPWLVMWHHTASATSPENDANYMCHGSENRPIANLMPDRTGRVWVLAAGCTNTNGSGDPVTVSRGTVPTDSMNSYAVGMEICNNGIGEPWPDVQIDAAFRASLAVTNHLGLLPDDVCTHHQYAPDRKIDPATAAAVQGGWQPGAINSSGTWSNTDLRAECRRRSTQGDDDVTDADIEKIVDEVVRRLPSAVWKHEIDSLEGDPAKPEPAKFYVQRAYLLARQYLGAYSKLDPPDPTVLQRVDNNVKKLL